MKNLFRIAALILVLAQLFVISAAAGEVPASYVEQMKAAVNGAEVKTSGAAEGSAAAVNAENEKKAKEAKAAEEVAAAAKEAAEAVIEYAFDELHAGRITAGHNPENVRSRRVIEKLGFSYTGDEFYKPTGLYHPSYELYPKTQAPERS